MAKRIVNKRRFTTSVIVIFLIFLAVILLDPVETVKNFFLPWEVRAIF